MTTLYLTPSETRRYAVELPVGDPWSGPAFGKKTMPVVAIAAAATSFAAGAAAFAAATTIGGMIAAGATIVGSALTIIGTVTNNSKLAKIGGILTIGGGLAGGMANPLGSSEAAVEGASQAAGEMAITEGGAINEAAHFSDAAFEAGMPSAASAAGAAPEAIQSATASGGGLIDMDPISSAKPMTDVQSQAFVDRQAAVTSPTSTVTKVSAENPFQAGVDSTMDVNATQVAQANQVDAFDPEMTKLQRQQAIAQGGGNSLGGYFDQFGRWVKNNKELAYIGANFASGLLPSEKDKAMTEAYKQKAADDRRRALWAQGKIA